MNIDDVVIIGAGPAGIAAAIQLRRSDIDFSILEKNKPGGLLWNANRVENYPGFSDGISGPDLIEHFQQQLKRLDICVQPAFVQDVEYTNHLFRIKTDHGNLKSRIVIVATGTKPMQYNDVRISDDCKDLIYYEIDCIRYITGKHIVIIGSGDAAFDYAINLSLHNRVTILNRSEATKCLSLLFHRVEKSSKIVYYSSVHVREIQRQNDKLIIVCDSSEKKEIFQADYLVIAIGRKPDLDCLDQTARTDQRKWIRDKKLFLIGDVNNGRYRQTAICVGDGVRAAMKISDNLERNHR